jgi:DNA-directed RNA polymerase specialized sigma subunit
MTIEQDQIMEWQKTKDPKIFTELIIKYRPVVNKVVNQYRTVGVSPETLRTEATSQLIKSFKTYKPSYETQPITHIWNNLKKVQRVASVSLMSGHIPENRALKKSTFTIVKDNLIDKLGYEPSTIEMADELGWSKKEVARMTSELGGEASYSKMKYDYYGSVVNPENPDKALADYLYHELTGKDRIIFEHTFGYAGKPILNNKEIADKLNVNEMWVHRAKTRLAEKIKSYR